MSEKIQKYKNTLLFCILTIILIILILVDIQIGSSQISLNEILRIIFNIDSFSTENQLIIREIRLPRVTTAILSGIALSISGLQMQTVFRNPLAGPYVLGISSGATLGVAIMIMGAGTILNFEIFSNLNNWSLIISACLGSAFVLMVIFAVSLRINDIMTILILGILFGSAITAFVSIIQYFSEASLLKSFIIWTLGSLSGVNFTQMKVLSLIVFAGLLISILSSKMLNVMLLGENYSKSLGLNILLSRVIIFSSTSILAGSITAFCGPIGFIGIAVPHISKIVFKTSNHKILTPACVFFGAIVMLISDIISHLPGEEKILPINSVTALLGIPIVLLLIVKNFRFSK